MHRNKQKRDKEDGEEAPSQQFAAGNGSGGAVGEHAERCDWCLKGFSSKQALGKHKATCTKKPAPPPVAPILPPAPDCAGAIRCRVPLKPDSFMNAMLMSSNSEVGPQD